MRHQGKGGASLFVVIFTTLIVTIVTVSFTQLMLRNQQQATADDMSQRAYNSALAGVEDAKRALVRLYNECSSSSECDSLRNAITSGSCDTLYQAGLRESAVTANPGNRYVETTVGAPGDNQAYTCVKIDTSTPDVEGNLGPDESTVVPLRSTQAIHEVKIHWFTKEDSGQDGDFVNFYSNPTSLPPQDEWDASMPPIMRLQYIPSTSVGDLDGDAVKTAFLYPTLAVGGSSVDLGDVDRRNGNYIRLAGCASDYGSAAGVCSATLELPEPTRRAYLQLLPLYNRTHFTVEIFGSGGNELDFDGVQPLVDSTGRAAERFRRVEARVKLDGEPLPYPNATISVKNDLCKDFSVGRTSDAYNSSISTLNCNPGMRTTAP